MPRIGIFVGPSRFDGGSYQYCLRLLEACAKISGSGFEFVVASTSQEWSEKALLLGLRTFNLKESFIGRLIESAFVHSLLPLSVCRKYLPKFRSSGQRMYAENCDFWLFPFPVERSYLIPIRAVVVIHDLMHRYEPHFPEVGCRREYLARERLFGNICEHSVAILVDSKRGGEHIAECYAVATNKIHIQPFLPPHYIYSEGNQNEPRNYQLPAKFFFYPAQFWPHKNHERLLRAFAAFRERSPDAFLALSGAPQLDYSKLKKLTENLDISSAVIFLGYVADEDIPAIYQSARALIYPSFFGPTNIPPLEAFALGCPVAVADVYGAKEQLGDAALYFDPRSETQIAETMSRLWSDDDLCNRLRLDGLIKNQTWGPAAFTLRLNEHLRSIWDYLKGTADQQ